MDPIKIMFYLMLFLVPFLGILTALAIRQIRNNEKYAEFKTNPVVADPLAGRDDEIRRLAGHILTGQSSSIVGAFSCDRIAILYHLSDPDRQEQLYGKNAQNLIFSLLDISILEKDCEPAEFWRNALRPLEEKSNQSDALSKIYNECKENNFSCHALDKLVLQMKRDEQRLVLMLHRFELLLGYDFSDPKKKSDFFPNLRRLASSRHPSSLCLIVSGHVSLKQFHEHSKEANPGGSPFLSFMESGEIFLGVLSGTEIDGLLKQEGCPFNRDDRRFIKDITGGHPYLLQVAVLVLWEAYEKGEKEPRKTAARNFPGRIHGMLRNIIQSLSSKAREAIVSLAKGENISDFENELDILAKEGFIARNDNNNWQISPRILADFINSKSKEELYG